MKRHEKPKLKVWPPARSVHEFADSANDAQPAQAVQKRKTPAEFQADNSTVRFLLRMSAAHHEMLAWLSETSRKGQRRLSMQTIALDLLEPAMEEAVKRRREELGV